MIERKILFIDDEETQRDVMQRILRKMGYTVTLSASSVEALGVLKDEFFPLIITDLNMDGMDGTILCKTIRETNTDSIIYALSGFIETYKTETLEKVGFDGYLRKPVTIKMLKQAIEGAFDKLHRTLH